MAGGEAPPLPLLNSQSWTAPLWDGSGLLRQARAGPRPPRVPRWGRGGGGTPGAGRVGGRDCSSAPAPALAKPVTQPQPRRAATSACGWVWGSSVRNTQGQVGGHCQARRPAVRTGWERNMEQTLGDAAKGRAREGARAAEARAPPPPPQREGAVPRAALRQPLIPLPGRSLRPSDTPPVTHVTSPRPSRGGHEGGSCGAEPGTQPWLRGFPQGLPGTPPPQRTASARLGRGPRSLPGHDGRVPHLVAPALPGWRVI